MRQPVCDQCTRLGASIVNLPLDRRFLCQSLLVGGPIFRLRHQKEGWPIISVIIERIFGKIVKKCGQLIKVFLSDWIEFVIVAVCASHGQSQEGGTVGFSAFALVVYA